MNVNPTPGARDLWLRLETLHAVTYFAEESHDAAKAAGLKGFWMGYFAFRAAPLGPVNAAVVEALFANFSPMMVRRAIPDAWSYAAPHDLAQVRAEVAAAALRRIGEGIDAVADQVNPALLRVVQAADTIGRPMFAANAAVPAFEDPAMQLWQLATTLREHRGDGHVALLSAAGLSGCEAHVLHAAEHQTPAEVLRDNRGWSRVEWDHAVDRLQTRGLMDRAGLSRAGATLRRQLEDDTDRLALTPFQLALDEAERRALCEVLTPAAERIASSGVIPFPNPMGLPRIAG